MNSDILFDLRIELNFEPEVRISQPDIATNPRAFNEQPTCASRFAIPSTCLTENFYFCPIPVFPPTLQIR